MLNDKQGCPATGTTNGVLYGTLTPTGSSVRVLVNPQGLPTNYLVEYGTTEAYGHTTILTQLANENGEQSETVPLTGLEPCTTYHYEVEVENKAKNKGRRA